MNYEKVHLLMEELKLEGMARTLDYSLQNWSKEDKDILQLLQELLLAERKERMERKYLTALRYSGLPFHKTLDEFDFTFQPSIDRKQIMELKTLRFLHEKENVVFLGPPGVGKTHLAVALGMEALKEMKKVYFVNAITLVDKLKRAFFEKRFEKTLAYYKSIDLLIIDELGYLPLDTEGAKLFFELVSEKYEKGSIVLTSNRGFTEWDKIFDDVVLATAVLDRLLHHCSIVNIRGKSFRLKEKQKIGLVGTHVLNQNLSSIHKNN